MNSVGKLSYNISTNQNFGDMSMQNSAELTAKLLNLKHIQLEQENNFLSDFAAKSSTTRGRAVNEAECSIRTEYQRDRDRIIHNNAFRRLKHKTQVFISPIGDHYRTRMTHTLEVSQISRTIARSLRLNEDLTEAIALGHDLGHTPFGHTGENVLNNLLSTGFRHNEQSVRVVEIIENLNLTKETIDGILNHSGDLKPATLEGQIVKISDRIAYLNHDIDDAVRAGLIGVNDLPQECIKVLGDTKQKRISFMVSDIILNSIDKPQITLSEECQNSMTMLRAWMFENVYNNSPAKSEEHKAKNILEGLFDYYSKNFHMLHSMPQVAEQPKERIVADYIAGMTDRFAIQKYSEIFIPSSWKGDI